MCLMYHPCQTAVKTVSILLDVAFTVLGSRHEMFVAT